MAKLFVLMVVAFVDMVGLVMLLPLLPFYATHFGANALVVGVLISAFSVAQLVSAPLWGWLSAVTSLGAVTGPALGSFLARLWGQMAPGIASAALCVLVSVFAWRFLRESREMRRSMPSMTPPKPPRSGKEAIWHVIAHSGEPAPRLIWIYTVAIGAFYGTVPIVPLLMSERLGVTEANIGYFVMYLGGMGVIVRAGILGRMVDWLGEARLSQLGLRACEEITDTSDHLRGRME